jgi:hypothetical protein
VRRADVLRDRTWVLSGRTFRWTDKAKYEAGGYRKFRNPYSHDSGIRIHMQRNMHKIFPPAACGGLSIPISPKYDPEIEHSGPSETFHAFPSYRYL